MGSLPSDSKPHVVCMPYPAQGHITPMLTVAKLLHSFGFHITFVNTEYNHRRLLRSLGTFTKTHLATYIERIPTLMGQKLNFYKIKKKLFNINIKILFFFLKKYIITNVFVKKKKSKIN
jgi:hypothetical protein